jgi:FAD/FMN-containing dehydrogenase
MSLPPDFVSELKRHFRGDVLTDTATRILYSTDASIYQMMPLGVAVPQTQDDLICAIELAAKYRIPVSCRAAAAPRWPVRLSARRLILDTSRFLNKIIAIDSEAQTATVEPGVILARLNAAASRHGLQYGPDPPPLNAPRWAASSPTTPPAHTRFCTACLLTISFRRM